jgi:K+-sensing histidine kinase KdpD
VRGALGIAAKRLGPLYGVPVAIAVGLGFDAFYIPPTRPFNDWQNVLVVATYLALGVLVGAITEASRRRAAVSEAKRGKLADEQAALRRVATLVAQGSTRGRSSRRPRSR